MSTEQLSAFLERDLLNEDFIALKQKVQDKLCYCESRRKILAEHVAEGYDKSTWEFNV